MAHLLSSKGFIIMPLFMIFDQTTSPPQVSFHTVGCRLNQAETAILVDRFKAIGYVPVDFGRPTDLLVLNTCSVTEGAEADCRRVVRRTLKESPQAFIAVTGCYAQTGTQTLAAIPGVDLVMGNQSKMNLPEYLHTLPPKKPASEVFRTSQHMVETFSIDGVGDYAHTRANLKIQDGCNFMCAFCLIPFAQGRERSRRFDDTIREAEALVHKGHQELVLTGVNIGQFQENGKTLVDLLERLEAIPALKRVRISSIEPTTIPDELIDYMAISQKLCRYLHVPLQSGDDTILGAMNRRYTVKEYVEWIERVVRRVPDLCVGTDLLAGFPSESDEQFANTKAVVSDLPFAYFHVFSYSPRPGTAAFRMNNPVDSGTIKSRTRQLGDLSWIKRLSFYQRFVGAEVSVLLSLRMTKAYGLVSRTII